MLRRLLRAGWAGMILSFSLSAATWALWGLLWPYVALLILALMTFAFWMSLDALWRFRHHMLEPKAVEVAGRVPPAGLTHQYAYNVDDAINKAKWEQAFRVTAQVAKYHGGSYSLNGLAPHFDPANYRATWEHLKAHMVLAGEVVNHKSRGMILLDYGRFMFRFNHKLIGTPPAPGLDAPNVSVWSRVPCKACMENTAKQGPA